MPPLVEPTPVVPVPPRDQVDPAIRALVTPYLEAATRRVLNDRNRMWGPGECIEEAIRTPLPTRGDLAEVLKDQEFRYNPKLHPSVTTVPIRTTLGAVNLLRAIGVDVVAYIRVAAECGVTQHADPDHMARVHDIVAAGWTQEQVASCWNWSETVLYDVHDWVTAGYTHEDLTLALASGLSRDELTTLAETRTLDRDVLAAMVAFVTDLPHQP